jgi:hypothetical protein
MWSHETDANVKHVVTSPLCAPSLAAASLTACNSAGLPFSYGWMHVINNACNITGTVNAALPDK